MKAIRLHAIHDLRLDEIAVPEPGPGEIQIRVEAAGLCGTDRHLFHGEFPCKPPVTLGHEFSGVVTACGPFADLAIGTRVTCDPNDFCMTCPECLRGRVNLCERNVASGLGRDGGFAEYAVFPQRKAVVLPADLNPLFGAFCEPLGCTLHGIDVAAPKPGERCIVIGGGVIGQMALQLARLAGAEVMMLTRSPEKQDLAATLGATHLAADAQAARKIWPKGADIVLECAGTGPTVAMAPGLTRTGGRVVILGVVPQGEKIEIEPFDLLFREVSMLSSFLNPFTHARAAQLIASGTVDIAPLVSRRVSLSEMAAAIQRPAGACEIRLIAVPQ